MIGGINISMHLGMLREINVSRILLASHNVWSKPLQVFNMFSFFVNFLNEEGPFFLGYDHACNFSCVDLPAITRRGRRIFYGHFSRLKNSEAIYIWLLILRSFIFFFRLFSQFGPSSFTYTSVVPALLHLHHRKLFPLCFQKWDCVPIK